MRLESRYVFDTGAVVSAVLFEQSVPGRAFYAALDNGKILVSEATFTELTVVLAKKKFDRYVTREDREQFLAKFFATATLVEISEEIRECRDPKDDQFLELAVSGTASCVVTGDQDLLILHPFRGIPVLTPAQFLEMLLREKVNGGEE